MNLNVGDKVRVVKEVYGTGRILSAGTVLEIILPKRKGDASSHLIWCVDQKGRNRYIHRQHISDGHFERISSAPVILKTPMSPHKVPLKADLFKRLNEMTRLQNILAEQKAREISMILEEKGKLEEKLAAKGDSGPGKEFAARLKASMRAWILSIQFSAPHSSMRKEIQAYLKELD